MERKLWGHDNGFERVGIFEGVKKVISEINNQRSCKYLELESLPDENRDLTLFYNDSRSSFCGRKSIKFIIDEETSKPGILFYININHKRVTEYCVTDVTQEKMELCLKKAMHLNDGFDTEKEIEARKYMSENEFLNNGFITHRLSKIFL